MKVPNVSQFENVREAKKRVDEIDARDQRLKARANELQAKRMKGISREEKDVRVAAVLAGEPMPEEANLDEELKKTMREREAVEQAKVIALRKLDTETRAAGVKICESIRPEHDKLVRKMCAGLLEAYTASTELFAAREALYSEGAGFNGLFDPNPFEVLGAPTDKGSQFWDFMRRVEKSGFCKELR